MECISKHNMNLLFSYNLQLFADEGGDKTEEPTSKKLDDTRKQGQVGKSQELAHAFSLITVFMIMRFFGARMGESFLNTFQWVYGSLIPDIIQRERGGLTVNTTIFTLNNVIIIMAKMVVPFFIIGFLVAALATGLQFTFKVSFEPLKPKFSKLNPISGIKRIFSKQALFNLVLAILKIFLIFFVAYFTVKDHLMQIFMLYELQIGQAVALVSDIIVTTGIRISLVYLVVGLADLIFQKWKFRNDIKMTKQEVKDEFKNAEGDPQIKGQIRQRMREASSRRMMKSVPQADVVITNPTRLAIALKYDSKVANAPVVVAKGEQYIAQKIKETAKESNVPIIENKPLARMLYATVDVGEQIPPELYTAVAEILAIIFTKREIA